MQVYNLPVLTSKEELHVLGSHELMAQMSFSDRNLCPLFIISVFVVAGDLKSPFLFFFRTTGTVSTKLRRKHFRWRKFQFVSRGIYINYSKTARIQRQLRYLYTISTNLALTPSDEGDSSFFKWRKTSCFTERKW